MTTTLVVAFAFCPWVAELPCAWPPRLLGSFFASFDSRGAECAHREEQTNARRLRHNQGCHARTRAVEVKIIKLRK